MIHPEMMAEIIYTVHFIWNGELTPAGLHHPQKEKKENVFPSLVFQGGLSFKDGNYQKCDWWRIAPKSEEACKILTWLGNYDRGALNTSTERLIQGH